MSDNNKILILLEAYIQKEELKIRKCITKCEKSRIKISHYKDIVRIINKKEKT
jgi:hypothetical protein